MSKFLLSKKEVISYVLVFALGLFMSALAVSASTTISTNVSTGGTLGVTGLSSLGQASSTMLSAGTAYFGGTATSSFGSAGTLTLVGALTGTSATLSSTLGVTGLSSLGQASTTLLSAHWAKFGGTASSTFNTDGTVTFTGALTGTDATFSGAVNTATASSTGLVKMNSFTAGTGSTVAGVVFGYCNIVSPASITASTSGYVDCTGATGVTTNYKVFVKATSSLQSNLIVRAASSTAASTITLEIFNLGNAGAITPALTSLNFFGLK